MTSYFVFMQALLVNCYDKFLIFEICRFLIYWKGILSLIGWRLWFILDIWGIFLIYWKGFSSTALPHQIGPYRHCATDLFDRNTLQTRAIGNIMIYLPLLSLLAFISGALACGPSGNPRDREPPRFREVFRNLVMPQYGEQQQPYPLPRPGPVEYVPSYGGPSYGGGPSYVEPAAAQGERFVILFQWTYRWWWQWFFLIYCRTRRVQDFILQIPK